MALKTDSKTLTIELKKAAKNGGNFVYAPSGDKKKKSVLVLSKKAIPPIERKLAKTNSGSKKVFFGTCHMESKVFIFQSVIDPPSTLGKKLKLSIKELTDYKPGKVEAVFAKNYAKQKAADENKDDDQKEKAAPKKKTDKPGPTGPKPKKLSNGAVLKFIRKSTAYNKLATKDFAARVKGKDPEFLKMFEQLKDALEKGDKKKVKEIARMKIKQKESPRE